MGSLSTTLSGGFLHVFAAGGNLTAPGVMLASEGVLDVLNTDTARVVRYHLATGAALGGPDDFIVPGTSASSARATGPLPRPPNADAGGLPDAWEHTHGLSSASPLDTAERRHPPCHCSPSQKSSEKGVAIPLTPITFTAHFLWQKLAG